MLGRWLRHWLRHRYAVRLLRELEDRYRSGEVPGLLFHALGRRRSLFD